MSVDTLGASYCQIRMANQVQLLCVSKLDDRKSHLKSRWKKNLKSARKKKALYLKMTKMEREKKSNRMMTRPKEEE